MARPPFLCHGFLIYRADPACPAAVALEEALPLAGRVQEGRMELLTAPHATDAPDAIGMMEARAAEAAALLRLLANERRLLLLCILIAEGEAHVGRLAKKVGLSQPALSQHLAKLREDGLVATRRSGTTIHYRIADPRVARIISTLHDVFCPTET
jgi:DNA-binding transcriptional ArsR family regulator